MLNHKPARAASPNEIFRYVWGTAIVVAEHDGDGVVSIGVFNNAPDRAANVVCGNVTALRRVFEELSLRLADAERAVFSDD